MGSSSHLNQSASRATWEYLNKHPLDAKDVPRKGSSQCFEMGCFSNSQVGRRRFTWKRGDCQSDPKGGDLCPWGRTCPCWAKKTCQWGKRTCRCWERTGRKSVTTPTPGEPVVTDNVMLSWFTYFGLVLTLRSPASPVRS